MWSTPAKEEEQEEQEGGENRQPWRELCSSGRDSDGGFQSPLSVIPQCLRNFKLRSRIQGGKRNEAM